MVVAAAMMAVAVTVTVAAVQAGRVEVGVVDPVGCAALCSRSVAYIPTYIQQMRVARSEMEARIILALCDRRQNMLDDGCWYL